MIASSKTVWSAGHSTLWLPAFLDLVGDIDLIVDIRQYPYSRRYPHFNGSELAKEKSYGWIQDLGGRRHVAGERHPAWRVAAFRSYAGYMETEPFQRGLSQLEQIASDQRTAFFCAEALWWRCHRRLVSDALVVRGWTVLHLPKGEPHRLSPMARVEGDGTLVYDVAVSSASSPSSGRPGRRRRTR
ncbi:MAG TPA: DUF488 domain-containing protein [Planctomycetota bacterium]|nr:DUF488 domain-containing protein [Planctomycetota bacterium]